MSPTVPERGRSLYPSTTVGAWSNAVRARVGLRCAKAVTTRKPIDREDSMSILRASTSKLRWCAGVVVAIISSVLTVAPVSATPSEIVILADSTLRAGDRNTNEGINPLLFVTGSSGSRIVLDFGVKTTGGSVGAASLLL